jgi:hypothetical protein
MAHQRVAAVIQDASKVLSDGERQAGYGRRAAGGGVRGVGVHDERGMLASSTTNIGTLTVGRKGEPVNLITVAFAIAAATRAELDR